MGCEYKAIWLGLLVTCLCVFVFYLFAFSRLLSGPNFPQINFWLSEGGYS